MIGEIDLQGVLIAPLLIWMLVAYLLNVVVRKILAWIGFYRIVWHRALFDVALHVVMTGGVVALSSWWISAEGNWF